MCRFLAYQGEPIFMGDLVCAPSHSLIVQSLNADEGKTRTNGDGFGLGWYAERDEPGLYRELRPAWSDENLRSLCEQVRSRMFLAHVRASTGTATTRANCHPFAVGRHLFMHNGQIGGYAAIRRRVEALIPDDLYGHRLGTADTEALFLAALADGMEGDAVGAVSRTLARVVATMRQAGVGEALRFTAVHSDGHALHGFRWASDGKPPSLYWRRTETGLVVASEPFDARERGWHEVPAGTALLARRGATPDILPIEVGLLSRAA